MEIMCAYCEIILFLIESENIETPLTIQHFIAGSSTRGRMRHLVVDELPELLQHVRIS